jgi:ketosteroid isomerase-like protein
MGIFPQQKANTVISSIAAVRQAWLDAVRAADAERLATVVTDDVVVVHGNGALCARPGGAKGGFPEGLRGILD